MQKDKVVEYMTRQNFVIPEKAGEKVRPTKLAKKNVYRNFDTNMRFFKKLKKEDFEKCLNEFLNSKELKNVKEIHSLDECKKQTGIYILVLDKYKQIYIGQTRDDFKTRITRHWRNKLTYLKSPFLMASILPIDCFGAKDTTRVFVLFENDQSKINDLEIKLINAFPRDYCLNKVTGGLASSENDFVKKMLNPFKRNFDDNFNSLKDFVNQMKKKDKREE